MGVDMTEYRAFISYNHKDRTFVRWLLERLERYRLPKSSRSVGQNVDENGRIGRIFCDREEFVASGNLSEAVQAALGQSQALIVVCSKTSRQSKWVNAEIAMFRSLHPDRPIFCAIVPDARDEDAVFPHTLLQEEGNEPLAADFRKDKDGKRLALLKLVAGLVSVPLDGLVQREAQRRQRRVTFVTLFFAVIAFIMAVLAVQAITARQTAERQRYEAIKARRDAEDLVGFMLGELREQLEPVGRLDALSGVGYKVLDYYEGMSQSHLDDEQLAFFANALRLSGETAYRASDLASAQRQFEAASEVTAEQLRRAPQDGAKIYNHAQSVFWLTIIDRQEGRMAETLEGFQRYYDMAVALVELDPDRLDWRMELAYGASNLGTTYYDMGDYARANSYFETGGEEFSLIAASYLRQSESEAFASALRELADNYAWQSDAQKGLGDFDVAIEMRCRQLSIYEDLSENSENIDWRVKRNQLSATLSLAVALLQTERHMQALSLLNQTQSLVDQLYEHEPGNAQWGLLIYTHQLRILENEVALGRRAQAQTAVERLEFLKRTLALPAETSPEFMRRLVLEAQIRQNLTALVNQVNVEPLASGNYFEQDFDVCQSVTQE